MAIRAKISKNTLADVNKKRGWRIYADDAFSVELKNTVYAFDSTTIDLCLSTFPWAGFHHGKAAIKLYTLLDPRSSIPGFIHITEGRVYDVEVLDELIPCGWVFLYNGPCLYEFFKTECIGSLWNILCSKGKEESTVQEDILP